MLAVFLDLFAVGLVVPLIPHFLSSLGASPSTIGVIGSFYGLAQVLGAPGMSDFLLLGSIVTSVLFCF
jgi:hypothetical protein